MTNLATIERVHDRLWPDATLVEKRRRLSKFSIAEISAVDKPAQEGAVMTIMKSKEAKPIAIAATPSKDPRILALERREGKKKAKKAKIGAVAKIVNENGITDCDPSLFAAAIAKRAAKIRRDGESDAQAYTRTIVDDSKGHELFRAMKASSGASPYDQAWGRPGETGFAFPAHAGKLPGADNHSTAEQSRESGVVYRSSAEARLHVLAEKLQSKNPGMSYQIAYTRVFTSPEHRALAEEVKTEGLIRQARGMGHVA